MSEQRNAVSQAYRMSPSVDSVRHALLVGSLIVSLVCCISWTYRSWKIDGRPIDPVLPLELRASHDDRQPQNGSADGLCTAPLR